MFEARISYQSIALCLVSEIKLQFSSLMRLVLRTISVKFSFIANNSLERKIISGNIIFASNNILYFRSFRDTIVIHGLQITENVCYLHP